MESKNPKLFVDGISQETNATMLKQYFSSYGEVKDALVISHKGFGFVTFSDPSMANNALQQEHVILGKKVTVKPAKPKVEISNRKIFVGGLPHTITLEELKEYFGSYGNITDAVVIYDKETQKCKGFGFVTYDSEGAAQEVLRNKFHSLKNKMVEVKKATPKEEMKKDVINDYDNHYHQQQQHQQQHSGGIYCGIYDVNSQPVFDPFVGNHPNLFWVAIPGDYQPPVFGGYWPYYGHPDFGLYF